jgi:hypothetical protein
MKDSFDFEVTPHPTTNPIIAKIDYMCQTCAKILYSQIISSKIYKKFVVVCDFKYKDAISRYINFDVNSFKEIEPCYGQDNDAENILVERHKFKPVVPFNAPINETLKEVVRNSYEVVTSFWNPSKNIDYITLESLRNNPTLNAYQKKCVDDAYKTALNRFILLRFMKHSEILKRRKKNNRNDVAENLYYSDLFDINFHKYINEIPYTMVIGMLPTIKKYCMENLKKHSNYHVEFYGCECESDYVIYKHLTTYNKNNHPTIYTKDSDIIQLLWNVDCNIRFNYNRENVNINPIKFWKWLFNSDNVKYEDIAMFCILSGTDYNESHGSKILPKVGLYQEYKDKLNVKEKLIFQMYIQKKYVENHLHLIEEADINELEIESKYYNCIYELVLSKK